MLRLKQLVFLMVWFPAFALGGTGPDVPDYLAVIVVFNSHIHGDHRRGNQAVRAAYPHAHIYAPPNMIELIDAGESQNWVKLMERLTDGKTAGTKVVNHGDEIRIDYYGKAHTNSDIMVEGDQGIQSI